MTIAWPVGVRPNVFMLRLQTNQRTFSSPFGGSEQTLDMLQDRWLVSLGLPPTTRAGRGAQIEAFLNAMRGQTQVCYLHHFGRPVPRGTMRGLPEVASATGVGWETMIIQTAPGLTLEAGDMIGVSDMLLQVREFCQAGVDGRIQPNFVNRMRKAVSAGAPVTWDRPSTPFRMVSPVGVQFVPGYAEGVSLDFAEAVDL